MKRNHKWMLLPWGRQEELRLAGTAEVTPTNFFQETPCTSSISSLICFNLKPKFYCYILSCYPRVPSVTVLTRHSPCAPVVDIQRKGPDGCFVRSRCRMQSPIYQSQRWSSAMCFCMWENCSLYWPDGKTGLFQTPHTFIRHFPFWPHLLQPEFDQIWLKVFCRDCSFEHLEQILLPSYSLTQKILVAILSPAVLKGDVEFYDTPPPRPIFKFGASKPGYTF